jgi:hypothetical protein
MEFKNSIKKWFYSGGTGVSNAAASATHRIPLLDASGNPIGSDTPANIELKQPRFTNGVFVATLESNYPRFRQPDQAAQYASSAVGVAVFNAGKLIVIAKDETTAKWADSAASGGSGNKTVSQALADMSGRQNTATIVDTLGSAAPAAYYCKNTYYASNVASDDAYFGTGRWWLPSAGELLMIWSHLFEINRLMAAIGGTPLNRSYWYQSSTESRAENAWVVTFADSLLTDSLLAELRKTYKANVRPVSSFYKLKFYDYDIYRSY